MKHLASLGPTILLLTLLFVFWQTLGTMSGISERLLPMPLSIMNGIFANWSTILPHLSQTFLETFMGLFCSIVLGVVTALFIDSSKSVRNALYPLLVTSQTIPLIALAPLFLLWFGFGIMPKVLMVILYCYFPIAIATATGLAQTPKEFLDVFKSMNANYWQTIRFVKLRASLPSFFAGLKIAVTYGVSGAIVGEYVGAEKGLGVYMQQMAHSYATVNVFAGIIITSLLSVLLFAIVLILEKKIT